jgi:hypothetical protein
MTETAVRDLTEKSAAYAKDTFSKTQAAAGETTKIVQQTYSAASRGAADFNLNLLDITQANMNAAFDFARELVEVSTAHARKQFETFTEQTRRLATLAQR